MDTVALRVELHEFINHADDKEVEAMYTVLSNAETLHEWWEDKKLIAELNRRYSDLISGRDKGMTMDEATAHLLNRLK